VLLVTLKMSIAVHALHIHVCVYSKQFYNLSAPPIKLRDAGKNPTAEKGKFTIFGVFHHFFYFFFTFWFGSLSHAEPVEHERIFLSYTQKRKNLLLARIE
jgi:hypothetical protein